MLGQVIATIIMAIGIATGNVSSNAYKGGNVLNTSQETTKPQIKKTTEAINDTYTWYQAQTFTEDSIGLDVYTSNIKYLIYDTRTQTPTANIANEYYNIYTTTYTMKYYPDQWTIIQRSVTLYKITTYLNFGATELTLKQHNTIYSSANGYYTYKKENYTVNDDVSPYIDLTYNANTRTQILQQLDRWWDQRQNFSSTTILQNNYRAGSYDDPNGENEYTINNIPASTTINVIMMTYLMVYDTDTSTTDGFITMDTFNMTGDAVIPQINYEIVDIPNLMFTILTLPFSFISNAFNLTIFPNTPYQLNFTNLFMTILSAFILMWIIRKVFK